MSEEYKKGYREGWADGYQQAKKEFGWFTPTLPYQGDMMKCPVCGRSGVHASVCSHPQCPAKVTANYTTSLTGAAGSSIQSTLPLGANGPSESSIKPKEPSFNHQLDYSEYENNTYRRD